MALIRAVISGHIGAPRRGWWRTAMEGKARFILAATMSSMMVLMVTLLVTWLNLGFRHDFLIQWAKAYIIAWPIAAVTGYLVMPMARRFTQRVVTLIDGHA
jgi:hypothetical protein